MNYELRNLTIGYGDVEVSTSINATLASGELTCLLGPNGAGKSTLLRTLAAFQPALKGEIMIGERNINNLSAHDRAMLISVVLTERSNLQNMPVRELVAMGRAPYTGFWGRMSRNDKAIVSEAIEHVGITHLADRMMDTLSDGERQKAMIAKAIAQQTPVILLDEPTAYLDYPSKVDTMQLLSHLCHQLHKTVFLSTHDLDIALQMADNLWLMEKRNHISIGTPRQLADNGAITRFINRPDLSFNTEDLTIKIAKKPSPVLSQLDS